MFADLLGTSVHVFLDDILICSKDIPSHLQHLNEVFTRLQKAGLKVKLNKCRFIQKEITFLGYVLDGQGVHTSQDKVTAVLNFPTPQNLTSLRSFLGLSGFYRSFIQNYSTIAKPLTQLLRKDAPYVWGDEQEAAFNLLKEKLCSAEVLAYPNFNEHFYLYTDASGIGLGAALMQPDHRGKLRPLAYASRVLNSAEKDYSTCHKEALAVIWSLRHFKDIIHGYPITVKTDHAPVVELFKSKDLSGKLARWRLTVLDFQPTFEYLPGKSNIVADSLSRHIIASCTTQDIPHNINEMQRNDPFCNPIIYYLESGDETHLPQLPIPRTEFRLQDGTLVRDTYLTAKYEPKRLVTQLVIPSSLKSSILQLIHDSPQAGHPGKDRCLHQARLQYYWPTMRVDINNHIDICQSCAETKGSVGKNVPILTYPTPTEPWETLAIDLLKLPLTENGYQYLLVCIDHFSRFSVLIPLKDKTAKSVATALIDNIFSYFNTPSTLLSDNGSEFNNAILNEICKQYSVTKCNSSLSSSIKWSCGASQQKNHPNT